MTPPFGNHFFVDEAGDLTLFDKKGRVVVGTEGVSRYFMLGVAELPDPDAAATALEALRRDLLADPYFRGVPSMQPDARKTALCFHAKNDVAEVRREVLRVIGRLGVRVQVAIRRKTELAAEAKALRARGLTLRPDDVYDDLVRRLADALPAKSGTNLIVFARRGKATRTAALVNALMYQQSSAPWPHQVGFRSTEAEYAAFVAGGGLTRLLMTRAAVQGPQAGGGQPTGRFTPHLLASGQPHQFAGLQVVDYYLWTVQRFFERHEDRFFNLLAADFSLLLDVDDRRNTLGGEKYGEGNPLTVTKIMSTTS